MPHIETIDPDKATGTLKKQFDLAVRRAGKVFGVLKIFSLRPKTLEDTVSLYRTVMFSTSSELTRAEREMVAVLTSQVNDCHY